MRRQLVASLAAALTLTLAIPASLADQTILDDLIVDGSACVGFDCVNGEHFGFDVIRFKENNLRIHFQDTSTSAAFPSNDWRIRINDSSNGGDNHFSIDDVTGGRSPLRIDAGAPDRALYVNASGHVGIATDDPALALSVTADDSPGIRLEQTTAVGWPAQVWDLVANEQDFKLTDTTAGTVPLKISTGAPDGTLVLLADGNGTMVGTLSQGSSRTIKHHIEPVDRDATLARVMGLPIHSWVYKLDAAQAPHIGPMAEDFYATFGTGADDAHLAASDVAGVALASIQALSGKVIGQHEELERLERENADLQARLARLERLVAAPPTQPTR